MRKKGQFQLGFGFIFSIILIIAFIVVAIIAINAFLGVRCSAEIGRFLNDFKLDVEQTYKGAGQDTTKEYKVLGCDFEYFCIYDPSTQESGRYGEFVNDFSVFSGEEGDHNVYFYPRKSVEVKSTFVNNINMDLPNNPYCFEKVNDVLTVRFTKEIRESLVTLR